MGRFLSGFVMLIIGLAIIYFTWDYQPSYYPLWFGIIIAVLGLATMMSTSRQKPRY